MRATFTLTCGSAFVLALLSGCNCGPMTEADAGTDAGMNVLPFQPSNIAFSDVSAQKAKAKAEDVAADCSIKTDTSLVSQDCFTNDPLIITQHDGSTVNLAVVSSLKVESGVTIRVTGPVPLIIVSLGDVTVLGTIDGHSESLSIGPGGQTGADSNAAGSGPGAGAAASASAHIGGSGGSACGVGGKGGGQTVVGMVAGTADARPLHGGATGGGGTVGSGAGGGAIQIVAAGTLSLAAGSVIVVGAEGGPFEAAAPIKTRAAAAAAESFFSRERPSRSPARLPRTAQAAAAMSRARAEPTPRPLPPQRRVAPPARQTEPAAMALRERPKQAATARRPRARTQAAAAAAQGGFASTPRAAR